MATTVKAGWLKDSQGNKFAPKTIASQVVRDDGTTLEDFIQNGSSVSWNDLQDRPFYETEPVETVIAEGTIPAGGMLETSASVQSMTLGETYKVIYDGNTYDNLVCTDVGGMNGVGDMSFASYPFAFVIANGNAMAMGGNNSSSHSIKVIGYISETIQLERKYIADHIDVLPGEKVAGKSYTVDSAQVTAKEGAEVFNDYENNIASGKHSHAEGMSTTASGIISHAEGWSTTASGGYSHAEGQETTASGDSAHAEGYLTRATNDGAHAEGFATKANGLYSHAEGDNAETSGRAAHAEGYSTEAIADYSHAEGMWTKASSKYQHVQGKYNIEDASDTYAHIVGNGSSGNRSNAHTLDWSGNAWFAGDVYVGGTSQADGVKVASESWVVEQIQAAINASWEASY